MERNKGGGPEMIQCILDWSVECVGWLVPVSLVRAGGEQYSRHS